MNRAPSVGVVIPTHDRPELVRRAIDAVLAQDYGGPVRVVVVYDRATPDPQLAAERPVEVLVNARTPGLAGARNTGIDALDTDLVAFCDDDDEWLPGKLAAQVAALSARPGAEFATCSILVAFDGRENPRCAGVDVVTHAQLLRSRMAMLHSSTFVVRRTALLDGIGLVDEHIPGSQNEDWDLLLRASARAPIAHVDQPLVRVRWHSASYFARQWETKIASLEWMLRRHPDIEHSRVGAARVYGQLAFAQAVLRNRRRARQCATQALRRHPREWRGVVALAVATGVVSGDAVLRTLHLYGRGV